MEIYYLDEYRDYDYTDYPGWDESLEHDDMFFTKASAEEYCRKHNATARNRDGKPVVYANVAGGTCYRTGALRVSPDTQTVRY